MQSNYDKSLKAVLLHEGGYVDHKSDPGGKTNLGVTQAVYDDWRRSQNLQQRSVRNITVDEASRIYRQLYWNAVKGDDLPSGVDYCVFDFAVNSGTKRSARYLQRAVSVVEDGNIGPKSVAAVKLMPPSLIIDRICDSRLAFLRGLNTFGTFGKGWTSRVEGVRKLAKGMA